MGKLRGDMMLGSPQCMPPCCAWGSCGGEEGARDGARERGVLPCDSAWGSCEGGRHGWGRSSHLPQLLLRLGGGAQQRVDEGADGVGGPGTIRRAVV